MKGTMKPMINATSVGRTKKGELRFRDFSICHLLEIISAAAACGAVI
jgi:hypothetical protein